MSNDVGVTVSQKAGDILKEKARKLAFSLALPYHDRGMYSLKKLGTVYAKTMWLVVAKNGNYLWKDGQAYHFHPNMAELRVREWAINGRDYLAQILLEKPVHCFLDATFGIGSDAIVASYVLPPTAVVVAVEKSLPVYLIAKTGMLTYQHPENIKMTAAVKRIKLLHWDILEYLQTLQDQSVDAIYFDFMFTHTVARSTNLNTLRTFAETGGMNEKIWQEAIRVARQRIILKDRPYGKWFRLCPPDLFYGGKYSKVKYGVWDHFNE